MFNFNNLYRKSDIEIILLFIFLPDISSYSDNSLQTIDISFYT